MPSEIVSMLENLSISTFCQGRDPVCLQTTSNVKDALQTFNTHKVLSCPIADTTQKAGVHGFLDVFDLLSYLLDLWDGNSQEIKKLGETFLNHNITDLIDRSDNDTFVAVVGEEKAHRLIRLFGMGVHRVALLDSADGSLANVLSQSDVVKFLNTNLKIMSNANKSIKELKMISSDKLITVDTEQTAISAFQILAQNLISAVPIVDKNGALAGTLSVSDLKLLQDDLSPLLFTTMQYKAIKEPMPSITAKADTTLGEVITSLANSNVHRVWVVDGDNKPISAISVTDVCEFLSQFLPKEESN